MPKVYPDYSNDRFDTRYSRRIALPSDVMVRRPASGTNSVDVDGDTSGGSPGDVYPGGGIYPNEVWNIPDDLELEVQPAGEAIERVVAGYPEVILPDFHGFRMEVYRNNIPQYQPFDYTWDKNNDRFEAVINPELGEKFRFMANAKMPEDEEYTTVLEGENKNNFVVDNPITFLTSFVGVRVRIFRNNIIQSFVTDYNWDINEGKITWLLVPPQPEETFLIKGY